MPPSRTQQRTQRPAQCVFKEGGRRCIRNGTGSPALCRAHRIAVKDAAEQAQPRVSTAFQQVSDLFEDFLSTGRINSKKVGEAVGTALNDFAVEWGMGGGYTGYHPPMAGEDDIDDRTRRANGNGNGQRRGGFRPPPGFRWPPGWHAEEAPIDVEAAELEHAAGKARVVLGFGPAEVITPEILKARFRKLALKHHPDRGGSADRMKVISAANDTLERWLAARK